MGPVKAERRNSNKNAKFCPIVTPVHLLISGCVNKQYVQWTGNFGCGYTSIGLFISAIHFKY